MSAAFARLCLGAAAAVALRLGVGRAGPAILLGSLFLFALVEEHGLGPIRDRGTPGGRRGGGRRR